MGRSIYEFSVKKKKTHVPNKRELKEKTTITRDFKIT